MGLCISKLSLTPKTQSLTRDERSHRALAMHPVTPSHSAAFEHGREVDGFFDTPSQQPGGGHIHFREPHFAARPPRP